MNDRDGLYYYYFLLIYNLQAGSVTSCEVRRGEVGH